MGSARRLSDDVHVKDVIIAEGINKLKHAAQYKLPERLRQLQMVMLPRQLWMRQESLTKM